MAAKSILGIFVLILVVQYTTQANTASLCPDAKFLLYHVVPPSTAQDAAGAAQYLTNLEGYSTSKDFFRENFDRVGSNTYTLYEAHNGSWEEYQQRNRNGKMERACKYLQSQQFFTCTRRTDTAPWTCRNGGQGLGKHAISNGHLF